MIAQITAWVKTIIFIVLFASFLELLLPAGGMRRFVRVIMGLLVMLVMLNPVVEVVQSHFTPDQLPVISGGNSNYSDFSSQETADVVKEREKLALTMYESDLTRQIRAVVMAVDGVAEAKVILNIGANQTGQPGPIEMVTVYIQPGIVQPELKVEPVEIGAVKGEKTELTPEFKEKVSRTIRELYQLTADQVEIKAMN